MRLGLIALLLELALVAFASGAEPTSPAWGRLAPSVDWPDSFEVAEQDAQSVDRLPLTTPFPHLVRVRQLADGSPSEVSDFEFNRDASDLHLVPDSSANETPRRWLLETAERSQQYSDGRVVFVAGDATVSGTSAKLERHPGNDRIGFWTNSADTVAWSFDATRWGKYRVWLTYSCASPDGSQIEIACGDAQVAGTLTSTGSWYRYTTIDLGTLYLTAAGKQQLTVRCREKVGVAVMNLKAVVLDPACEGTPPVQADDGVVTLHGRDATVHGVMLRYEPAEKKQTLGYWTRAEDRAVWTFTVARPGTFDVEVWQGCGAGQGGSPMLIRIADRELRFQVVETGHFQNFQPRTAGVVELPTAGDYSLSVQPERIANKAACDIRQIRLVPRPDVRSE